MLAVQRSRLWLLRRKDWHPVSRLSNGDFWAVENNGTLVKEEDGTTHEDEEKAKELKEKWPLPEKRLLGKSAGEYLPKGQ